MRIAFQTGTLQYLKHLLLRSAAMIVLLFLFCMLWLAPGCSAQKTRPSGESAAFSTSVTEITSSEPSNPEVLPGYTFDLTGDVLNTDREGKLTFFCNSGEIVILGGESGVYRLSSEHLHSTDEYRGYYYWGEQDCYYEYFPMPLVHTYSMDKKAIVFLVNYIETEPNYAYKGSGDLMYYNGVEANVLALDVINFAISNDGTGVAYITDTSDGLKDSELYVYDAVTEITTLISNKAEESYVLSPDGDTIGYCEYAQDSGVEGYVMEIGKGRVSLGSESYPLKVTNQGETIYYLFQGVDSMELWVQSGENQRMLSDALPSVAEDQYKYYFLEDCLIFNSDGSQIIYWDGEEQYFSMNGEEPVNIPGGLLLAQAREIYDYPTREYRMKKCGGFHYLSYDVDKKNLCNLLFQGDGKLTYFDENMEIHTIDAADGYYNYYSEDGLGLIYSSYDAETGIQTFAYDKNYLDPNSITVTFQDTYVERTVATTNDTIFYGNDIGQIYRVPEDGTSELVATYARIIGSADYGDASYLYYYVFSRDRNEDSTSLYCIEDRPGALPVLIDSNISQEGYSITDAGLIYQKTSADTNDYVYVLDIYASEDGVKFKSFTVSIADRNSDC